MKWDDFKEAIKAQSMEEKERMEYYEACYTIVLQLTELRKKRNMTQRELAKRSRLKRSTILNIENLKGSFSLWVLIKIANALGVRLSPIENLNSDGGREKEEKN